MTCVLHARPRAGIVAGCECHVCERRRGNGPRIVRARVPECFECGTPVPGHDGPGAPACSGCRHELASSHGERSCPVADELHFDFHAGAYRAAGGYVIYAVGLSDDGAGSNLYNAERRTPTRTYGLATYVPLDDALAACQSDHARRS